MVDSNEILFYLFCGTKDRLAVSLAKTILYSAGRGSWLKSMYFFFMNACRSKIYVCQGALKKFVMDWKGTTGIYHWNYWMMLCSVKELHTRKVGFYRIVMLGRKGHA